MSAMTQREIKFRAYCPNEKIMLTEYAGNTLTNGGLQVAQYHNSSPAAYAKDLILMQFTGLKDKNGKDIYEGDIFKYTVPYTDMQDTIEYTEKVVFNFGSFELGVATLGAFHDCGVVIGNIHENHKMMPM